MTSMNTKSKKNTITMMHLWFHLTKRKKKAARVKMRMIKNPYYNNEKILDFKIRSYHFKENTDDGAME